MASRFGIALALALGACGGGSPLLHPAHPLAAGRTAFGAGMSDRLVLGAERSALDEARAHASESPTGPVSSRAALIAVAEGPAIAPWVSARVGISGSNEAGLSFTGDALRADARHAFDWGQTAFSAGLGVTGHGIGHGAVALPNMDLDRVNGFGLDLPLLYGYRTDADVISLWAGLRGAYDHWSGRLTLDSAADSSLHATRISLGPVVGLAVGIAPIYVAAELEVDYARVTGSVDGSAPATSESGAFSGVSFRPAGALIAKF